MAKRILTLCLALVIGIAFAMPAVAAVKSIKVGGDITIRGIYRQNLDFTKDNTVYTEYVPGYWYINDYGVNTYVSGYEYSYQTKDNSTSWLMTTTRVWVAADLTDNISAVVRLLNERDWASSQEDVANTDVDLDLAYIKMKDLFVPGFSATLGRQEILLGKGFVVGNVNGVTGSTVAGLRATDLTSRKAFDAVRLDYEVGTTPITVTVFDAKIAETAPDNGDCDLSGINVGYKADNLNVAGYVLLLDEQTDETNKLLTFGARIDHNVIPGLNYNIEAAMQSGKYAGNKIPRGSMEGWAGNADVSYTFQSPMELKLGAAWYYASGDEEDINGKGNWIPLYPDNLSDRIGRITYAYSLNTGFPDDTGSNLSIPKVYASFKPSEKNTLSLAWFPDSKLAQETYDENEIGTEVNFGYTYQYTEDVSFGVCLDYAQAGEYRKSEHLIGADNFDSDAWQAMGTVSVVF